MVDATPVRSTSPVAAWEALFRAQVTVMRSLSDEFPSQVISLTEYDVLYTLSIQPNRRMRIRDLNVRILLTQPSVSRLVDRLASRGIVSKSVDPSDGRGTIVSLTDQGFQIYRDAARVHGRTIASHMTKALTGDELGQLLDLCDKLRLSVTGGADTCIVDDRTTPDTQNTPDTPTTPDTQNTQNDPKAVV